MSLLNLESHDHESCVGFSLEEYELLRQVREEQAREERAWSMPFGNNDNVQPHRQSSSLKIRQRSFTTIASKVKIIAGDKNMKIAGGVLHADSDLGKND
jgi:hypothetical protein